MKIYIKSTTDAADRVQDAHKTKSASKLRNYARDREFDVRRAAAGNPNTPADALALLYDNARFGNMGIGIIREALAANPSTPKDVLMKLVFDTNKNQERRYRELIPDEILSDLLEESELSLDAFESYDGMSVREFMAQLVAIYNKKFPNSMCCANLHFINYMTITLQALLHGEGEAVRATYWGDADDPFNIIFDIEFKSPSRGDITLDTHINLSQQLNVDIRSYGIESSDNYHVHVDYPPLYGDHFGDNYASVLVMWSRYVDNIYNTLRKIKFHDKLPTSITDDPILRAKVDSM